MAGSVWSAAAYKMQARKRYNDHVHTSPIVLFISLRPGISFE